MQSKVMIKVFFFSYLLPWLMTLSAYLPLIRLVRSLCTNVTLNRSSLKQLFRSELQALKTVFLKWAPVLR